MSLQKEIRWLLEEKYGGKTTEEAKKDIRRLQRGEPLDYVIGWVEFLGCKIDVSQKSLIPRPETEYWVQKAIQDVRKSKIKNQKSKIRCLDIFAGSGCIGIVALKHIPLATVDFAEKERRFLKQIKVNAHLNGVDSSRYRLIQSDIFSRIFRAYDYMFANPPYVAESRKTKVQKSVLQWEPRHSIFGGKDGLRYITTFLREAKHYLKPRGTIYMEFDSPQEKKIARMLKEFAYREFEFFKDQYGRRRYIRVQ
ncbi:MAG: HemK family protein methyltransferase [Patescibacteria group bacterium]